MSHLTLAQQGVDAVSARNWDDAVTKLSKALQTSQNPSWLIARSKALVGLKRFRESLDDADLAWTNAYQRAKRPQLVDAHYRRAVAYYRLGEYANADCCCVYAMRLVKGMPAAEKEDPRLALTADDGSWKPTLEEARDEAMNDPMNARTGGEGLAMAMGSNSKEGLKEWRAASTLRCQILYAMGKLPADDPGRKATVTQKPQEKKLAQVEASKKPAEPATASSSSAAAKAALADAPLRLQDFQTDDKMSISIFSKGVDKAKLQVEFLPRSVRLDPLVYPSGEQKEFILHLWGEIDAASSTFTVTPSKVELSLKKEVRGKWASVQGQPSEPSEADLKKQQDRAEQRKAAEAAEAAEAATATAATDSSANTDKSQASGASYPTSSRSGPKNWDAIDTGEDDDDAQDVNYFFKKLYKNATPEQQRAMMKSFTESNGTSLSTDWSDVKDRTVESVPPEGVEAKKWE